MRVVAATHAPLEQRVDAGDFRRDLFHRLECFVVRVPPLRERRGDIGAIARELLASAREGRGTAHADARRRWRASLRTTGRGTCASSATCCAAPRTPVHTSGRIEADDIDRALHRPSPALAKCVTSNRARELLRENAGNLSAAARAAGMPRTSFRKLLT